MEAQTTSEPKPEPVPETEEQKEDNKFKWFKIILVSLGVIALACVLIFYFGTPCTDKDASTIKKVGCAIGDALGAVGKVLSEVANNFWALLVIVGLGGLGGKILLEWYKKTGEKASGIDKAALEKQKKQLEEENEALKIRKNDLEEQVKQATEAEQEILNEEIEQTDDKIKENQDDMDKIDEVTG